MYNMACCHALLKQKAPALAALQQAVECGYRNWRRGPPSERCKVTASTVVVFLTRS